MVESIIYRKSSAPFSSKAIENIIFICSKYVSKIKGLIEVTLISKQEMKRINFEYRGFKKATDVLSFSALDHASKISDKTNFPTPFNEKNHGYIYLCPMYIKEQAKRFNVSYKEEFVRMLIHALLHTAGYDHIKEKQAQLMFKKQELLVERALLSGI